MKMTILPMLAAPLLLLGGCGAPDNASAPVANNAAAPPPEITAIPEDQDAMAANEGGGGSIVDSWEGRWTGPEGLFLDIAPDAAKPGQFALTIKDSLDTQGSYTGTARGESISFTRKGKAETIRAGSGKDSGFKYLADKQDCLIIVPGKEGYCRD